MDFTEEEIEGIIKTMQSPKLPPDPKIPLRGPLSKVQFAPLTPSGDKEIEKELFEDVQVTLDVVYGSKIMTLKELSKIRLGEIVTLQEEERGRVEIRANGQRLGWGEVVEVDGHFGVRVLEFEE